MRHTLTHGDFTMVPLNIGSGVRYRTPYLRVWKPLPALRELGYTATVGTLDGT